MSSISILEKIESLPPLPRTIIEIEEFRKKVDKDPAELIEIIEKDALIISTLLKISNSPMFGFRSKVESPSRAVNLLGINFTISIAIGGTIQNMLVSNLEPYGISSDDFMRASNISSALATIWLSKIDFDLKEELVLPSLLQEAGKFVLSDVIISDNKFEIFKQKLSENKDATITEKEVIEHTTSEVTAKIFKHWKLSPNLIAVIEYVDDISQAPEEFKEKSKYLDVVKTACDVRGSLNDENIQKALAKAKLYGFDTKVLQASIDKLQDRLLDEL